MLLISGDLIIKESGSVLSEYMDGKQKLNFLELDIVYSIKSCYHLFIGFPCRTGENMKKRKTLQDLTIKDNFLFGAVMSVEKNCKGFLEMVLGFPIAHVVVSREKSIVYHPE